MNDNSRLSLEEFLAINEKYIEYKKKFDKNDARNTVFGALLFITIFLIFTAILLVTLKILLSLLILIGLMVPAIFFCVSKDKKEKQKLEKYGADLYREYLKQNNFI